jgi:NAD-dependent SIR2 family protein deacetylase|tara:strand:+ start:493 stop:756 length:264 start_codon:yes stop_codon:yes gene_type:complete
MNTQNTNMTQQVAGWITNKFKNLQGFLSSMSCSECFGDTKSTIVEVSLDNDLSGLKLVELKSIAKEKGLKGYSGLRKSELIDLLNQN